MNFSPQEITRRWRKADDGGYVGRPREEFNYRDAIICAFGSSSEIGGSRSDANFAASTVERT